MLVMRRRASDKEILLLIEDYVLRGNRQAYDELVTLVYRELQKNIYYTLKKFDKSTAENTFGVNLPICLMISLDS